MKIFLIQIIDIEIHFSNSTENDFRKSKNYDNSFFSQPIKREFFIVYTFIIEVNKIIQIIVLYLAFIFES